LGEEEDTPLVLPKMLSDESNVKGKPSFLKKKQMALLTSPKNQNKTQSED